MCLQAEPRLRGAGAREGLPVVKGRGAFPENNGLVGSPTPWAPTAV